jgi:molybdopterin adenylyltransferase
MQNSEIKIGFVTVSDRASRGEYEDLGGPAMQAWMALALKNEWTAVAKVVADEQNLIESTLIEMADIDGCSLIVTTGGTGPAKRDVTPEATANVCDKILDGFAEQMRAVSLQYVPTAILSRQIAGTRGSTLIINLPGKPSAISECLEAVFPAVPYCIDLIEGGYLETDNEFIKAFRPKHAIKPAHVLKNQQG